MVNKTKTTKPTMPTKVKQSTKIQVETTKKTSSATPSKKKKVNYLNNKDMLAEVVKSKEQGKMTNKLAHMLQTLAARYGRKGNYSNYTYNDDMQAYAMYMLVKTWDKFNPEKSSNPFAFFTQCIKHSFIQYLNQEKRQRDIRDSMLVEHGLTPSYTYQMEHSGKVYDGDLHESNVGNEDYFSDSGFSYDNYD